MILAGGEDRRPVFLLPFRDDARLFRAAPHHEGRRAARLDHIATLLGGQSDLLLVSGHDRFELVARAASDADQRGTKPMPSGRSRMNCSSPAGRSVGRIKPTIPRQLENDITIPLGKYKSDIPPDSR